MQKRTSEGPENKQDIAAKAVKINAKEVPASRLIPKKTENFIEENMKNLSRSKGNKAKPLRKKI